MSHLNGEIIFNIDDDDIKQIKYRTLIGDVFSPAVSQAFQCLRIVWCFSQVENYSFYDAAQRTDVGRPLAPLLKTDARNRNVFQAPGRDVPGIRRLRSNGTTAVIGYGWHTAGVQIDNISLRRPPVRDSVNHSSFDLDRILNCADKSKTHTFCGMTPLIRLGRHQRSLPRPIYLLLVKLR